MHEAPRGHGGKIVVERPLVEVGDAAQQQRFDAHARRLERWIFCPLSEDGPEHEAKEARVLVSELDISKARPSEEVGPSRRALHRRRELAETLGGDGSKKIVLAGEMPVCGGRRHADAPRGLRRAAIVITDGGDTHSRYTKKEILDYLEEADVPLFAINASEPNIFQNWTVSKNGKIELVTKDDAIGPAELGGPKVLKELTNATGGTVFTAHDGGDIPRIMSVVYDLISNQYTLFYKPHAGTSNLGDRHKIQVRLAAKDNRFDGYHLEYKRQYYRPAVHRGVTTALSTGN